MQNSRSGRELPLCCWRRHLRERASCSAGLLLLPLLVLHDRFPLLQSLLHDSAVRVVVVPVGVEELARALINSGVEIYWERVAILPARKVQSVHVAVLRQVILVAQIASRRLLCHEAVLLLLPAQSLRPPYVRGKVVRKHGCSLLLPMKLPALRC